MKSWHGILLKESEIFWSNLRTFAYFNRTIFEILFILIYTIEQIILIVLTFNAQDITELSYIISIFAVIVLTTFSFHKIIMESRIKFIENEINALKSSKKELETNQQVIQREANLFIQASLAKELNSKNVSYTKKGDRNE